MKKTKFIAKGFSDTDIEFAPPPFMVGSKRIVPVDIHNLEASLVFNVVDGLISCRTKIRFTPLHSGYPLFDFFWDPTELFFDSQSLPPSKFHKVYLPESNEHVKILDAVLESGLIYELEIAHILHFQPRNGGVRYFFSMNDLFGGFLERYLPSNLEFDQFSMTLHVEVSGATSPHRLFINGQITQHDTNTWSAVFPDYFTCSSCYFHLTNSLVEVRKEIYSGVERTFPVTVYSENIELVDQAMQKALAVISELETTYGPYTHDAMLIRIVDSNNGMEYCGAAISNVNTLGHEILHSWFARGVMPANGNAGWIDEAIASWRDNGYPRAVPNPNRPPVNLAGSSPYHRSTSELAYSEGALLLSELDYLFADTGGLRSALKDLYLARSRRLITTLFFQSFLEQQKGVDLSQLFAKYVFGIEDNHTDVEREQMIPIEERLKRAWLVDDIVKPPMPFTCEALLDFK